MSAVANFVECTGHNKYHQRYQADSYIYITGRSKDMIIINGRNIWPQDIEHLAEANAEIRTGDAMAFFILNSNGEELAVVMVECREKIQHKCLDLVNRMRRKIHQELGIDCIIKLVPRNCLTRTTSGKPSRHATKNYYLLKFHADQQKG